MKRLLWLQIALLWLAALCVAFGGDVKLAWENPTTYTDGSLLDDFGGVKIGIGSASRIYSRTNDVGAVSNCTVTGITPGTVSWSPVVTQRMDKTSWTVTWQPAQGLPGPSNYFAGIAYSTNGLESDWSDELVWTAPAPAATNYTLRWGTTAAMSAAVNLGTGAVWQAQRTAYNRTILYAALVARMTDGSIITNPTRVVVNNRKSSPPKNLMVTL